MTGRKPDSRSLKFADDVDEQGRPLPMTVEVLQARTRSLREPRQSVRSPKGANYLRGTGDSQTGLIAKLAVAGLNSTPALIGTYVMFVICLLVPTVSYKRSIHERDKKGRVRLMRSIAVRFSGRKLAASLVASCSVGAGYLALSGGSG
jgi:hypothetical protein